MYIQQVDQDYVDEILLLVSLAYPVKVGGDSSFPTLRANCMCMQVLGTAKSRIWTVLFYFVITISPIPYLLQARDDMIRRSVPAMLYGPQFYGLASPGVEIRGSRHLRVAASREGLR